MAHKNFESVEIQLEISEFTSLLALTFVHDFIINFYEKSQLLKQMDVPKKCGYKPCPTASVQNDTLIQLFPTLPPLCFLAF